MEATSRRRRVASEILSTPRLRSSRSSGSPRSRARAPTTHALGHTIPAPATLLPLPLPGLRLGPRLFAAARKAPWARPRRVVVDVDGPPPHRHPALAAHGRCRLLDERHVALLALRGCTARRTSLIWPNSKARRRAPPMSHGRFFTAIVRPSGRGRGVQVARPWLDGWIVSRGCRDWIRTLSMH